LPRLAWTSILLISASILLISASIAGVSLNTLLLFAFYFHPGS
jgi:hypothetical protein